jgi:hypothetical protein
MQNSQTKLFNIMMELQEQVNQLFQTLENEIPNFKE